MNPTDKQPKLVKLSRAWVDQEELKALEPVFLKAVYFGLGSYTEQFEKGIASYLQTGREVIGLNSGTAALHLALMAYDFPKGSEIIIPSITFVACFQAALAAGLTPIACDVVFPSGQIDPSDLKKRLSSKTAAIMPVSYTGGSFDRQAIYDFAAEHGLKVVEDNAHAFGSKEEQGMVGSFGGTSCFSFDGIKNITCGEGGAVVTADKDLAHRIRVMRALGIEKDVDLRYKGQRAWDYDVAHIGYRYHMSDINAAIGLTQLSKIDKIHSRKAAVIREYHKAFAAFDLEGQLTPSQIFNPDVHYHIFPVLLPRDDLRAPLQLKLREYGFESGFHYAPNHFHSLFKTSYSLPGAEQFARRVISLPLHPDVPLAACHEIAKVIHNFLNQH